MAHFLRLSMTFYYNHVSWSFIIIIIIIIIMIKEISAPHSCDLNESSRLMRLTLRLFGGRL